MPMKRLSILENHNQTSYQVHPLQGILSFLKTTILAVICSLMEKYYIVTVTLARSRCMKVVEILAFYKRLSKKLKCFFIIFIKSFFNFSLPYEIPRDLKGLNRLSVTSWKRYVHDELTEIYEYHLLIL